MQYFSQVNEIKTSKLHPKAEPPLAAHFHLHDLGHLKLYKSNLSLFFFHNERLKKKKSVWMLFCFFFSIRERICTATRTPLWFRHRLSHLRDIINLVGFTGESKKQNKQTPHPVKLAASLYAPSSVRGEHKSLNTKSFNRF